MLGARIGGFTFERHAQEPVYCLWELPSPGRVMPSEVSQVPTCQNLSTQKIKGHG